jgi:hypothetical protein
MKKTLADLYQNSMRSILDLSFPGGGVDRAPKWFYTIYASLKYN